MPQRIGKVKIFTQEGQLIREGLLRESDVAEPKLLGLFSAAELVKGSIIAIGIIFGAGVLWQKMDTIEKNSDKMWSGISANKSRLECVQNQLAKCCRDSVYCS